jgi:hypothetical protein
MGRVLALITALLLLFPVPGAPQDSRAALEAASKALGADGLKTIQYSAGGVNFAIGQSPVPGAAWPRFSASCARSFRTTSSHTARALAAL